MVALAINLLVMLTASVVVLMVVLMDKIILDVDMEVILEDTTTSAEVDSTTMGEAQIFKADLPKADLPMVDLPTTTTIQDEVLSNKADLPSLMPLSRQIIQTPMVSINLFKMKHNPKVQMEDMKLIILILTLTTLIHRDTMVGMQMVSRLTTMIKAVAMVMMTMVKEIIVVMVTMVLNIILTTHNLLMMALQVMIFGIETERSRVKRSSRFSLNRCILVLMKMKVNVLLMDPAQ